MKWPWKKTPAGAPPKPYKNEYTAVVRVKVKGAVIAKYEMSLHAHDKKHAHEIMRNFQGSQMTVETSIHRK